MAVIVIEGAEIDSDLITKISSALGTSNGEVIHVLKQLCFKETNLTDVKVDFSDNIFLHHREPVRIPPIDFLDYGYGGYSYHPNHGETCDHLWVDPSDIHDQLCAIAGYFMIVFCRKCFMQLKTFSNLRFA